MPLGRTYESLDEVPEQFHALYEEREGKFIYAGPDVEPSEDEGKQRKRVNEQAKQHRLERDRERKRAQELQEQLEAYGDLTPGEARELRQLKTKQGGAGDNKGNGQAGNGHDPEAANKLSEWERRMTQLQERHQRELGEVQSVNQQLKTKLREQGMNSELASVASELRVNPDLARAWRNHMKNFAQFDEDDDGKLVVMVDDLPVPFKEWAARHWANEAEAKHFLLAPDSSGGGPGGAANGRGLGPNPWKKGPHFNLTRQSQIKTADPARARRMMQEAGVPVR